MLTSKFLSIVSNVCTNQNPSSVSVSVIARFINKNAVDETFRSLHITNTVILNINQNLAFVSCALVLLKNNLDIFMFKESESLFKATTKLQAALNFLEEVS